LIVALSTCEGKEIEDAAEIAEDANIG